jgi:hypothetical protein
MLILSNGRWKEINSLGKMQLRRVAIINLIKKRNCDCKFPLFETKNKL